MVEEKKPIEGEAAPHEEEDQAAEINAPFIIDLGKTRPKRIKAFKRGRGKLMDEVADVIDEVQTCMGDEAEGKTLIPVIMVYEKKRKKKRRRGMFCW